MNNRDTSAISTEPCSLGERIKQVRRANGLTQKNFAESLGIAQGFLCAIERGRKKPSATLLIAMQHTYNIDGRWLCGEGGADNGSVASRPSINSKLRHGVPLLQTDSLGGTNPIPNDGEEYIALPGLPENAFAIKYCGDFMTPSIRDGDIVVISPGEPPSPGKIVLITGKWEEPFLRRYRSKGGEIYFTADNSGYSPFKSDDSTRILGVVVSVWRRINL